MTLHSDPPTPFHLGPWLIDPIANEIVRDDKVTRIEPKSTAVLTYLAARAGEVVTRDELLKAVWPDVVVTDASLTRCVSQIRQALEDHPRQPVLIETVPTVGYRLLQSPAKVESAPPVPSLVTQTRGRWIVGLGIGLAAACVLALGVLWKGISPVGSTEPLNTPSPHPTDILYETEVTGTLTDATISYTSSNGETLTDTVASFPYTRLVPLRDASYRGPYEIEISGRAEDADVRLYIKALRGDSVVIAETQYTGTATGKQQINAFTFLTLDE
ncbi:MAG: transcriptional regulator [Bacteroidota bacterium]